MLQWGRVAVEMSIGHPDAMKSWLGFNIELPCCSLWSELNIVQQKLRKQFEMQCASRYVCADGRVCPACQVISQASWIEERNETDVALQRLLATQPTPSRPVIQDSRMSRKVPGKRPYLVTILTWEDADRGSGVDQESRAVLLTYVDAVRNLAFFCSAVSCI